MLSYQHGYHAGNFADVHKHSLLSLVLQSLRQKDKPFIALDMYAGRGRYTLSGSQAQKTGEFEQGIARLWPDSRPIPAHAIPIDWPEQLSHYSRVLNELNPDHSLQFYPGSPSILHAALREADQLQLCELHPAELDALKIWQRHNSKAKIHERDAHEALLALIPPSIKRGVVLIDPSYDIKAEYQDVATSLIEATRKWPQGIFLLWYPILAAERHRDMLKRLQQRCKLPMLQSELQIRTIETDMDYQQTTNPGGGMHGSGMLMINPPWQLDNQIAAIAPWLEQLCEKDQSDTGHKLVWLREAV